MITRAFITFCAAFLGSWTAWLILAAGNPKPRHPSESKPQPPQRFPLDIGEDDR